MEDDYLLDEDDEPNYYMSTVEDDDDDDDEDEDLDDDGSDSPTKVDYNGLLTKSEIFLSSAYNDIKLSEKKRGADRMSVDGVMFDGNVVDAIWTVVKSSPKNTSLKTVDDHMKKLLNRQGRNRIPSSVYTPDKPIRSNTVDDYYADDDEGFNEKYITAAREQVARFVKFLSERDLSRDSITSKRRKQRQLPAFIIFLFSSNMYDLLIDCPTMPTEYANQIKNALRRIQKMKMDIVEGLAQRYESRGRDEVAEVVRKKGLTWFEKEPAEILTQPSLGYLKLTQEDVSDYREFRPRYINVAKTITQEVISDLIEVVIEPGKLYYKLKDKTRSDAISDVKEVYKKWSEENPVDSDIAEKIVWKDLKLN